MTSPDQVLATRLATEAGQRLVATRAELFASGAGMWTVKDTGDAVAQEFLMGELTRERPDDAVLSEEGREDPRRFGGGRVWIIDPLDGTKEFAQQGRVDWAVHVALWDDDHFVAGAVSLPALDTTFAMDPPPVLPAVDRTNPRLITSRNSAPYSAHLVYEALDCEPVRLGSAGAKTMAVVMGEADIYVHDGGMFQWDTAAPAAIALAAGLFVSRIDGSQIVYNERDPWLPDFIVCRPELADDVLRALWG